MPTPGDQYRASVVCHVHFDGANGSTTVTDTTGRHVFSAAGNAQLSTARPKFGTAAGEFDGVGDDFESTDNPSDFQFASGNFTIEGWAQVDSLASTRTLLSCGLATSGNSANDFRIDVNTSGNLVCSVFSGSTQLSVSKSGITAGTTFAFAFERHNGNLYAYVDGVVSAATAIGVAVNGHNGWFFIGSGVALPDWDGMIDEVRVTKGIGRYQGASYTPTASPFPEVGIVAEGFLATNFGTPTRPNTALGFLATNFGTPRALQIGFRPTSFGTPVAGFGQPATGFVATNFGAGHLQNRQPVTALAPSTRFGTPARPHTVTVKAAGQLATHFGRALVIRRNPPVTARTVRTIGFKASRFGIPAFCGQLTTTGSGFLATNFGEPGARFADRVLPDALDSRAQFGTPTLRDRQRANGFSSTRLGTPTLVMRFAATAVPPKTRFGTPSFTHPHARIAYGWRATRFGIPRLKTGSACGASGFFACNFGEPSVKRVNRVSSIPPATFFGTPQFQRNPRC